MDHFFLKRIEFWAIVDRHSGMLSVHRTAYKGAKELIRILRLHCQRNGTPQQGCIKIETFYKIFFRATNCLKKSAWYKILKFDS